jgi:hypothetical protein
MAARRLEPDRSVPDNAGVQDAWRGQDNTGEKGLGVGGKAERSSVHLYRHCGLCPSRHGKGACAGQALPYAVPSDHIGFQDRGKGTTHSHAR